MLDNSVIICDPSPKLSTKKSTLRDKRKIKNVLKVDKNGSGINDIKYVSPLTSIKRRRKKSQSIIRIASEENLSPNNSVIILSDNESERSPGNKEGSVHESDSNQYEDDLHIELSNISLDSSNKSQNKSKSFDTEKLSVVSTSNRKRVRRNKKRKRSAGTSTDCDSCLLISDTEDSRSSVILVDLDNENIDTFSEPEGKSNQSTDELVVVWSSNPKSNSKSSAENKLINNPVYQDCATQISNEVNVSQDSANQQQQQILNQTNVNQNSVMEQVLSKADANQDSTKQQVSNKADANQNTIKPQISNKTNVNQNSKKQIVPSKGFSSNGFFNSGIPNSGFPNSGFPNSGIPNSGLFNSRLFNSGFPNSGFSNNQFPNNGLYVIDCHPNFNNLEYLDSQTQSVVKKRKLNVQNEIYSQIIPQYKKRKLCYRNGRVFKIKKKMNKSIAVQTAQNDGSPKGLRQIIIDGCNIAMAHTNGKSFSEEGIRIVADFFIQRGHSVKVFVPHDKRSQQRPLLEKLYRDGIVIFTPSRNIAGKKITPYDDRFILQYATMCGGIVVSLDQYRDLYKEKPEWRDTIENRLLAPTFVGDYIMFPEDPLGRDGPRLNEFLSF